MIGSQNDLFSAPPKRARIEIIPLIDVIFFLLATFVLFTLSLNRSGGLRLELPAVETSLAREAVGAVTVSITAEGNLAWDQERVTSTELTARLQAYQQMEPNPRILLNGDENAPFSIARGVIDEIRKAGISKILIETRLRPASP